jgi:hypothetical protein
MKECEHRPIQCPLCLGDTTPRSFYTHTETKCAAKWVHVVVSAAPSIYAGITKGVGYAIDLKTVGSSVRDDMNKRCMFVWLGGDKKANIIVVQPSIEDTNVSLPIVLGKSKVYIPVVDLAALPITYPLSDLKKCFTIGRGIHNYSIDRRYDVVDREGMWCRARLVDVSGNPKMATFITDDMRGIALSINLDNKEDVEMIRPVTNTGQQNLRQSNGELSGFAIAISNNLSQMMFVGD